MTTHLSNIISVNNEELEVPTARQPVADERSAGGGEPAARENQHAQGTGGQRLANLVAAVTPAQPIPLHVKVSAAAVHAQGRTMM